MSDALELLRAVNVPLLLVTTLVLFVRVNDMWGHLGRGRRIIWSLVVLFFANAALASTIQYITHAPTDPTVAVATVICLGILLGAGTEPVHFYRSHTEHADDEEPTP